MARAPIPPPSPERDRALAAKPRNAPRGAVPVSEVLDRVLDRETLARMRRFGRVAGVLARVLTATERAKVRPATLTGGILTLEVDDGMLLAELAQHRARALAEALIAAGTSASTVKFRLARGRRR